MTFGVIDSALGNADALLSSGPHTGVSEDESAQAPRRICSARTATW
jgi:hypothetical protein